MSKLKRFVCQANEVRKVTYETLARDKEDARRLFESGNCGLYAEADNNGVTRQLGQIMEIRHDAVKNDIPMDIKIGGSNGD